MKKEIFILTLLACVLFSVYSCKRSTDQNVATTVKEFKGLIFGKEYSLISRNTETKHLDGATAKKNDKFATLSSPAAQWTSLTYDEYEMGDIDLANFNNYINTNFSIWDTTGPTPQPDTTVPVRMVLYLSQAVDMTITTAPVVLYGMSKFYLEPAGGGEYHLVHRYYKINGTNGYLEPNLTNTTVNEYTSVDINTLLDHSLANAPSTSTDPYKMVIGKDISGYSLVGTKKLGETIVKANLQVNTNPGSTPGPACECSHEPGDVCVVWIDQVCQYKKGRWCALPSVDPGENYDAPSLYDFRDNFLMTSTTGQKYAKYYYQLCYINYSLDLSYSANMTEYAALLSECYTAAGKLIAGDGSDVIVTDEFYEAAHDVLSIYESSANYSYYQSILQDISADLDLYKNKTRDEVFGMIF